MIILNNSVKSQDKDYQKQYRANNKKKRIDYLINNRQELSKYGMKYRREKRIKLMNILGGVHCVKCPQDNYHALQFDHIKGNGTKDVKDKGGNILLILYYLEHPIKAKQTLQVLCASCNWIKRATNKENHRNIKHGLNKIDAWMTHD